MATALDIITDALQKLGVYAPGDTITDADAERGLITLNDMLDSWSNESLTTFATLEQSAPLIVGQSAYTIGTGGNFNMTRPIRIIEGPGAAYIQDPNGNNYSLDVVPRDVWNLIGNRSNTVTANVPNTLFFDSQFPLAIMNFYPFPNSGGYTAFWDSYLQLTDFANLTSVASLPPGYNLALKSNLAVALKMYFRDAQLDPDIKEEARISKGNIKRSNIRMVEAVYDPELVSHATGTYNVYTDSSNARGSS